MNPTRVTFCALIAALCLALFAVPAESADAVNPCLNCDITGRVEGRQCSKCHGTKFDLKPGNTIVFTEHCSKLRYENRRADYDNPVAYYHKPGDTGVFVEWNENGTCAVSNLKGIRRPPTKRSDFQKQDLKDFHGLVNVGASEFVVADFRCITRSRRYDSGRDGPYCGWIGTEKSLTRKLAPRAPAREGRAGPCSKACEWVAETRPVKWVASKFTRPVKWLRSFGPEPTPPVCEHCEGTGNIDAKFKCPACRGTGIPSPNPVPAGRCPGCFRKVKDLCKPDRKLTRSNKSRSSRSSARARLKVLLR